MTFINEILETKKATFYSDKIVLKKRKKEPVVINSREIDKLCYARPTFLNYLFAEVNQVFPGQLVIWLKKPLKDGKKAGYVLRIKYDDFIRLPQDLKLLTEQY